MQITAENILVTPAVNFTYFMQIVDFINLFVSLIFVKEKCVCEKIPQKSFLL